MAAPMYQVSVTFHDVAACFSAEEWGMLGDWQKELYKKVMMEIHHTLQGMGFEILNPNVLFRIKKVKDLYTDVCDADRTLTNSASSPKESSHLIGMKQEPGSTPDSCRRRGGKPARHPACTPDLLLRIKQDDPSCYRDLPPQSPPHREADIIVTQVFSLQKDAEEKREEIRPPERPEVKTTQSHRQIPSKPIKQEKIDYMKIPEGGHISDSTAATTKGRASSQLIRQDGDYVKMSAGSHDSDSVGAAAKVSGQVTNKSIKQEEMDYLKVAVDTQRLDDATGPFRDMGEPPSGDTGAVTQFPGTQVPNSHGSHLMYSPSPGVPRLRIMKFTEKELDVLVDLVLENYSKLFGKEADITPTVAKNAMWQAIANEVSAVGVASRTSDKVKKRWKDAKRKMNEKLSEAAAHVAETGRRPPPHLRLAPYEQRLRDFFKPEFSNEIDWNQDKEDHPDEIEADRVDLVHQDALVATVFSPACQEMEDSSKDSSEEPLIISPGNQPHFSEIIEDQVPVLDSEPEHQDPHFSTLNRTLNSLSSHQRESNVLMQEQNAILTQIAYSLNLLHIHQTEGLSALGSIIQQGVEAIRPSPYRPTNDRTSDHASVNTALRRQVMGINRSGPNQPLPPKRKIT
ncbi:uncharacterized protein PAF06_006533 [Gastrophryne carolinensis]